MKTNTDMLNDYYDNEWGVPVYDDRLLFECLVLEGAQAGLNWSTILARRENYRRAFDNFQPEPVAAYGDDKIEALLQDPGLIRNRLKIRSAVQNARAFLQVQAEFGSFSKYIWGFVGGKPRLSQFETPEQMHTQSIESAAMSRDLKKRGFTFVGPTICYAYMQAVGMVNDHPVSCHRSPDTDGG